MSSRFEHQVKNMYVCRKVQIFSTPRRPEKISRHTQCRQQAIALTGSNNIIQNAIVTAYEVESQ